MVQNFPSSFDVFLWTQRIRLSTSHSTTIVFFFENILLYALNLTTSFRNSIFFYNAVSLPILGNKKKQLRKTIGFSPTQCNQEVCLPIPALFYRKLRFPTFEQQLFATPVRSPQHDLLIMAALSIYPDLNAVRPIFPILLFKSGKNSLHEVS